MKKPNLYLETSVWNHLFVDDAPDALKETEALFAEIVRGAYDIYISDLVIAEINQTKDEVQRGRLNEAVSHHAPKEIRIEREAIILAEKYITAKVIPPSAENDALHVAAASVEKMDVIVSLNMRHIVRVKTRKGINGVNMLEGYRGLEIATPREVLGYGGV